MQQESSRFYMKCFMKGLKCYPPLGLTRRYLLLAGKSRLTLQCRLSSTLSNNSEKYINWTKDELIKKVIELESKYV